MIKKIIFVSLLALLPAIAKAQSTYTAASCSQADIATAVTAELVSPVDGDIIAIPAGNCTWTGQLNSVFTTSVTIQGAGAISAIGHTCTPPSCTMGTDQTSILDHNAVNSQTLWNITCASGKTCRYTGIAIAQDGSSRNESNGQVIFSGSWTTQWRVDHNHLHLNGGQGGFGFYTAVIGVGDHNYFDATTPGSIENDFRMYNGPKWNGSSETFGQASWNDTEHFGTNLFWFIEDNYFYNGDILDCHTGGRYVLRYNTAYTSAAGHGVEAYAHSLDSGGRSCRAYESYNNTAIVPGIGTGSVFMALNGGTSLVWGNTVNGYRSVQGIDDTRRGTGSGAVFAPTPADFAFCGPAPVATGTASVAAGGTTVTGTGFSTSWATNGIFYLVGATCTSNGKTNAACPISSVTNSTTLILSTPSAAAVTNGTYTVGSAWDSNNNSRGYSCMDGGGRGSGDLLTGSLPSMVNSTTGTIAWPHQALIPLYIWGNTFTPATGYSPNYVLQSLPDTASPAWPYYVANQDYYQQYGTYGESGSNCTGSPCNITVGVNQTNRAPVNGTDTCTGGTDPVTSGAALGVGWWNTANSTLYVCNPTNTWTTYYTPYTYPHPLVSGQVDTPTFSPVAGSYSSTQNVTISTTTGGATLCYTTDGSTPTANGSGTCTHGTTYSTPVVVASTLTVKAVGSLSGKTDSAVGSAGYTIGSQVATPTFSPVAGAYAGTQNVTISTSTGGATLCYTTDGTTPTANGAGTCTHGTTYSTPVVVASSQTLSAIGSHSGQTDSAVGSAIYTINVPTAPSVVIIAKKGH